MATYEFRSNKWRGRVRKKDKDGRVIRVSKTFRKKEDAEKWTSNIENSIQTEKEQKWIREAKWSITD